MNTVLELVFTDVAEKDFIVRVTEPRADLSPQEIKGNMDQIIAQDVFKTNNGSLVKPKSARFVTKTVETFDLTQQG